jgi:hypothetical protein
LTNFGACQEFCENSESFLCTCCLFGSWRYLFDAVEKRRKYGPSDEYLDEADSKREYHWLSEIQSFGPTKGVIILCGMNHAQRLSEELQVAGFDVMNKTLKDWDWYTELRAAEGLAEKEAKAQC